MVRPSIKRAGILGLIVSAGLLIVTFISPGGSFFGGPMLADVTTSVGVPPNPYNSLNEQLDQKRAFLDEREAYLDQREMALGSGTASSPVTGENIWYLTGGIIAVAILLIINFYLDWRREHRERRGTIEG